MKRKVSGRTKRAAVIGLSAMLALASPKTASSIEPQLRPLRNHKTESVKSLVETANPDVLRILIPSISEADSASIKNLQKWVNKTLSNDSTTVAEILYNLHRTTPSIVTSHGIMQNIKQEIDPQIEELEKKLGNPKNKKSKAYGIIFDIQRLKQQKKDKIRHAKILGIASQYPKLVALAEKLRTSQGEFHLLNSKLFKNR